MRSDLLSNGRQVKAAIGNTTTYCVSTHYQVDNGVVTKYYSAGATRIATPALAPGASVRKNGTLYYLLTDHLGSTSLTLTSSGSKIAELRYKAWGETRYTSGTTYTAYQFTSQRNETALGLYFYNARWYDPALARFTRADTLVPAGVQGYDRYAYANNNPLRYVDPSGHDPWWCETATCERKYAGRFSSTSTEIPLRDESDRLSAPEIGNLLRDEANAIKDGPVAKATTFVVSTAVGAPFALIGCGESAGLLCLLAIEAGANLAGMVGEELVEDSLYEDANKYEEIARTINEAVADPDTKGEDTLTVTLTPLPETGSLVSVDEYGYQTLNPDYNPLAYLLTIEGASHSILLNPNQASFIDQIFSGGLFP